MMKRIILNAIHVHQKYVNTSCQQPRRRTWD